MLPLFLILIILMIPLPALALVVDYDAYYQCIEKNCDLRNEHLFCLDDCETACGAIHLSTDIDDDSIYCTEEVYYPAMMSCASQCISAGYNRLSSCANAARNESCDCLKSRKTGDGICMDPAKGNSVGCVHENCDTHPIDCACPTGYVCDPLAGTLGHLYWAEEAPRNCIVDMIGTCGDGTCDCLPPGTESCASCPSDCWCIGGATCHPGHQDAGSDGCAIIWGTTPIPPSFCGDGTCDSDEICSSCTTDCGCAAGETCDSTNPISDENGCAVSETLEICDNNLDDDEDGFIDCADGDCSETDACYRVVSGTVLSGGGKPLKNVYVALASRKVGTTAMASILSTTFTDENGYYEIDYSSKDPGVVYGDIEGILVVELKDEAGRFQIVWEDPNANIVYPVETKSFMLPKKESLDIKFTTHQTNLAYYTRLSGSDTNWDASKIYYDTERALTFIQKDLGYDFSGPDNPFPLNIYIYSSKTKSAFYSYGGTGKKFIAMSPKDSKRTNPECPENCIWHELFHATQHNKYGQSFWDMPAADKNHAGFKNSKTGDSLKEGFAEFWPNIISMKLDGDTNGIYGNLWRMEMNYNPWMKWGEYEEFAFATMLWDLVDNNPDGEQLSLYYQDLWDLLMSKSYTTIGQVYDDLKKKWPEYAGEIDKVFVAHGLFKDTNEGNKKWDYLEPFWNDNNDKYKDANEKYIDIGTPDDGITRPHQVYDEGKDTIGTPSNYERPSRENKPLDSNSFVKIDAPEDALFKVSYTFTDPSLNYETYGIMGDEPGYVYVEIAPDEYGMAATITIDNYESSDSVTVTNDDYYTEEAMQNGFMKIATIKVGANKTNYCNNNGVCDDTEVSSCGDCSVTTPTGASGNAPSTTTPTTPGTTPSTTGTTPQSKLDIDPMLIAAAMGGLIFLILLILIIKRVRRPKQPPAQPQQPVYYQQQPQQGNVIIVRQHFLI